jgi:hypothetical protein
MKVSEWPKYDARYSRSALIWLRSIFQRTFVIRHSRGTRERERKGGWNSRLARSKSAGRLRERYRLRSALDRESQITPDLPGRGSSEVVLGLAEKRGGCALCRSRYDLPDGSWASDAPIRFCSPNLFIWSNPGDLFRSLPRYRGNPQRVYRRTITIVDANALETGMPDCDRFLIMHARDIYLFLSETQDVLHFHYTKINCDAYASRLPGRQLSSVRTGVRSNVSSQV